MGTALFEFLTVYFYVCYSVEFNIHLLVLYNFTGYSGIFEIKKQHFHVCNVNTVQVKLQINTIRFQIIKPFALFT